MVTDLDVRRALKDLASVYKRPDGDRDDMVATWRRALGEVDPRHLEEAVVEYMRSERQFFPKPGQLLVIIRRLESESYGDRRVAETADWNQLQDGPCPICGAVMRVVTDPLAKRAVWDHKKRVMRKRQPDDPPPTKRLGVIHDRVRHQQAGVPIVGLSN